MRPIQQITNTILMIRPANFGYNAETAQNNAFQNKDTGEDSAIIASQARDEFDQLVDTLRDNGIRVIVIEDTPYPVKPDAVFPNNWISFHHDGLIVTYPMFSKIRRLERRNDIIEKLRKDFTIRHLKAFERYESEGMYLEGTGSLILDRPNKLAFACTSIRTNEDILEEFSRHTGYQIVSFQATDDSGQEIYHTNVMMAVGTDFVIICMDSIQDLDQQKRLRDLFSTYNKEVIEITMEQMNSFAGNMLQVKKNERESILVMSSTAYHSLTKKQISAIERHTVIVHSPVPTIEKYGGGSVRCMMAEVFLPEVDN